MKGSSDKMKESPFQLYLKELYEKYKNVNEGDVADYIPELAKVNPNLFGISLVTTDGTIQEIGDTNCGLTMQSISKPFIYGLILEDLGINGVLKKINSEPSGDAFNSISLEPITGRPLNPMINAGAIATTSCVKGHNARHRIERILATLSAYAGKEIFIDQRVYNSEKKTGHRNRAIAHMLRNFDIIEKNLTSTLNLYFQQCSILVNCQDLAIMAATLANDGVNPITGIRAVNREYVPLILSVMSLCGMYDYSGRWIYEIGIPAKSGVSGGIIAVLPGQFGLSVFSPRLDIRGNSVRGTLICKQFSQDFGLHLLRVPKTASSVIRTTYSLKQVRSKRFRKIKENLILDEIGDKVYVFELQGEMRFSTAEAAVRKIFEAAHNCEFIIVDFRHVPSIDSGACKLLEVLIAQVEKINCSLLISCSDKSRFSFTPKFLQRISNHWFDDLEHGVEWSENQLIEQVQGAHHIDVVSFSENEMCNGMSENEFDVLLKHTKKIQYKQNEFIIKLGDLADKIFFLTRGEVSVCLHKEEGGPSTRISTLSAGMFFGELSLTGQKTRTADVIADSEVECHVLSIQTLNSICETNHNIKIILLENTTKRLVRNLLQSNREEIVLGG
jgi:glutaminase